MTNKEYSKLFDRDLGRLADELNAYQTEESLWIKVDGISNSAGNLFLHLCGNLQHFIGATLANSGYKRDREFEFAGRTSIEQIANEIKTTQTVIDTYLQKSNEEDFTKEYPLEPLGYPITIHFFLNHLLAHLNYHLGQINYHRRILS